MINIHTKTAQELERENAQLFFEQTTDEKY